MEQLDTATSTPPVTAPGGQAPAQPPVRRRTGPSLRPALIVVGIAAGLVILFGVGAALTTGGSSPPPAKPSPAVKGSGLEAEAAVAALAPIVKLSTPPHDVLDALVLPRGAKTVSASPWQGQTQYSAKMRFSLVASQASVVTFYKSELRTLGWSISSVGAAHDQAGATEVLAQRASTDGWYWEVGVVVSPTTFGSTSTTDTTRFTLDLFEVPDAQ